MAWLFSVHRARVAAVGAVVAWALVLTVAGTQEFKATFVTETTALQGATNKVKFKFSCASEIPANTVISFSNLKGTATPDNPGLPVVVAGPYADSIQGGVGHWKQGDGVLNVSLKTKVAADVIFEVDVDFQNAPEAQGEEGTGYAPVVKIMGVNPAEKQFDQRILSANEPAPENSFNQLMAQDTVRAPGGANEITLTIECPNREVNFQLGDTITIAGMTGSSTDDNEQLPLTGTGSPVFGSSAKWTQATGTLILTVKTAGTCKKPDAKSFVFDLKNGNTPQAKVLPTFQWKKNKVQPFVGGILEIVLPPTTTTKAATAPPPPTTTKRATAPPTKAATVPPLTTTTKAATAPSTTTKAATAPSPPPTTTKPATAPPTKPATAPPTKPATAPPTKPATAPPPTTTKRPVATTQPPKTTPTVESCTSVGKYFCENGDEGNGRITLCVADCSSCLAPNKVNGVDDGDDAGPLKVCMPATATSCPMTPDTKNFCPLPTGQCMSTCEDCPGRSETSAESYVCVPSTSADGSGGAAGGSGSAAEETPGTTSCSAFTNCEVCKSADCSWTEPIMFFLQGTCNVRSPTDAASECADARQQQFFVFLFAVVVVAYGCHRACSRVTGGQQPGNSSGEGGGFSPVPVAAQEDDNAGLVDNGPAMDDLEEGWGGWEDEDAGGVQMTEMASAKLDKRPSPKKTVGKKALDLRPGGRKALTAKRAPASGAKAGVPARDQDEKVRLKLNVKTAKSTSKERGKARRGSKGRKSLEGGGSDTPGSEADIFSSFGMAASPKFKHAGARKTKRLGGGGNDDDDLGMPVLQPTKSFDDLASPLEPTLISLDMDADDAPAEPAPESTPTQANPFDSPQSPPKANPFDNDEVVAGDGWNDGSDDDDIDGW